MGEGGDTSSEWTPKIQRLSHLPDFYKWQEKLLYKECEPEYMPSACGTIQVGSLSYFRNHYENEIADKREGKTDFEFFGLGMWSEVSSWLNNNSFGRFGEVFPERLCPKSWPSELPTGQPILIETPEISINSDLVPGSVKFDFLIGKDPTKGIDLITAICKAKYVASNAFIFCLRHSTPDDKTLKKYTAYWNMDGSSVQNFAELLAKSLAKNAASWSVGVDGEMETRPASEFGTWNVRRIGDGGVLEDGLYIFYAFGDVLYLNEGGKILLSANYPWSWSKVLFFMSPFFKTFDYSDENETRIVFYLGRKSGNEFVGMNPGQDKVILSIEEDLLRFILES